MLSLSQALTRWGREPVIGTTADEIETMRLYSRQAQKITMEINTQYHEPEELRQLFSRLIGRPVDDTFAFFSPFYTDFGKNIHIGKHVFFNSGCKFQDQAAFSSVIMSSSAIMSSWLRSIIILTRINGVSSCPAGSSWKKAPGSGPMRP